ncbi:MAG: ParB/RepB/Spo0J family partition protein, partial [Candidatus Colwellbacteria bacterium]|nr:ParB/RepB/Spo0J family partition protein [Candidatus Colwellbacteria bacterium]
MLGKGLESLIPSGGYKKPEDQNPPYVPPVSQPQQPPHTGYPPYIPQTQSVQAYPAIQPTEPVAQATPQIQYQRPIEPTYSQPTYASEPAFLRPEPTVVPSATMPEYQTQQAAAPSYNPYIQAQPVQQQPQPAWPTAVPIITHPDSSISREVTMDDKNIIQPGYSAPTYAEDYSRKQDSVFQIEVERIFPNPHQPRRYFDEGALIDLANSIREFGIIQPLVVTKVIKETETGTEVTYQLIAGERRLMAAKKVGLRTVPAIVKQVSMDRERLELAIIENVQRENLNPLETARSYARLQDEFGLTQREIAIRMGKSRETIANTLRLLNLPTEIQEALQEGKINESHARILLQVGDISKQREMFNSILH